MKVNDIFDFETGSLPALEKTDEGDVPLVYGSTDNNGVVKFVKVDSKDQIFQPPLITVSYLGTAFVQVTPFTTSVVDKSNIIILKPKQKMSLEEMYFHAIQINRTGKFGFNYGRRMNMRQLRKINLLPFDKISLKINFSKMLPAILKRQKLDHNVNYKEFSLIDVFDEIGVGEYHVSSELSEGNAPFISCITGHNGIIGYFDIPVDKLHKKAITIACDGQPLTAFYHPYNFNAQDNVMIYKPKKGLRLSAVLFILLQLKNMKWRFSYGRKCYKNKLVNIKMKLPVKKNDEIDQEYVEKLAKNCYGWNLIEKEFG